MKHIFLIIALSFSSFFYLNAQYIKFEDMNKFIYIELGSSDEVYMIKKDIITSIQFKREYNESYKKILDHLIICTSMVDYGSLETSRNVYGGVAKAQEQKNQMYIYPIFHAEETVRLKQIVKDIISKM